MDDVFDWTRQRMMAEIKTLRAEAEQIPLLKAKNKKLKKKVKSMKGSIIKLRFKIINLLKDVL